MSIPKNNETAVVFLMSVSYRTRKCPTLYNKMLRDNKMLRVHEKDMQHRTSLQYAKQRQNLMRCPAMSEVL